MGQVGLMKRGEREILLADDSSPDIYSHHCVGLALTEQELASAGSQAEFKALSHRQKFVFLLIVSKIPQERGQGEGKQLLPSPTSDLATQMSLTADSLIEGHPRSMQAPHSLGIPCQVNLLTTPGVKQGLQLSTRDRGMNASILGIHRFTAGDCHQGQVGSAGSPIAVGNTAARRYPVE